MVPRRIMVATDGSKAARVAEMFAADLANALRECEVRLVTVIRPIVVGNRGLGGFGRLAMGSTSTQVIQEAHCPVVVVKD